MRKFALLFAITGILILVVGCSPRYTISQHLNNSLAQGSNVSVSDLKDELATNQPIENRPTQEQVDRFKKSIRNALRNRGLFTDTTATSPIRYEVRPYLTVFEKGSAVGRFILGALAGADGKITVRMTLVELEKSTIIFEGMFSMKASSWFESSGSSFQQIAIDFATALRKDEKAMKKIAP